MTKERKTRNVRGASWDEEENVCSKKQFLNNCMQCLYLDCLSERFVSSISLQKFLLHAKKIMEQHRQAVDVENEL
jgi:hypothetical protein